MTDALNDLLASMLPEARLGRLEAVVAQRLSGLTVVLEDLHHPQNMGACVRTAEALGLTEVTAVDHADDPFRPTHKISRGGQKWLQIRRFRTIGAALDALEHRGFRLLATSPDAEVPLDELDFSEPTALMFGNELDGLSMDAMRRAHGSFRIPMFGFTQSLNISVAVGIALAQAAAGRRRALGRPGDLTDEEQAALRERFLGRAVRTSTRIAEALAAQKQ